MFNRFLRTVDPTQPWLLTEGALRSIMAEASGREESFEAIAKKWGEHLEGSWETQMYGDVAVIPVSGVLMKQLSWWSFLSDSSAYDMLLKEIAAALDNPQVRAVILDVDSPGGEVTGCAEVAQHIYDLRGSKPLIAYTTGNCASAAYWIASSCDEVVVSPTSLVGSIGVVKSIRDYSKAMEKAGVTEIEIVSSQSPYKRTDPASKDRRTREQRQVDALADVFIDAVARNRAVSRNDVLENFGQGDCFVGQLAVDAGLADRTGSLEELIAELGAEAPDGTGDADMALTLSRSTKASARIAAKANEEDKDVADDEEDEFPAAEDDQNTDQAEGEDEDTGAEGEDDDVDAEGDEEDTAEGEDEDPDAEDEDDEPKSKSKAKAKASSEKARISGILRHAEASGRGELAEYLAFETNMTIGAAAKILKAAPKAGAGKGKLGAAMAGKNPSIRPGSASAKSEDEKAVAALAWAAKHLQGA